MPRFNPLRTLQSEQNLAARIRDEREQKGWSYEGFANRMERAGYPIQPSAIFKIEKGDPPRRITVDELVGFSTVLELPIDELLVPVEVVRDRRAREMLEREGDLMRKVDELCGQLIAATADLYRYARDPSRDKQVARLLMADTGEMLRRMAASERGKRPAREVFGEIAEAAKQEKRDPIAQARATVFKALERAAKQVAQGGATHVEH